MPAQAVTWSESTEKEAKRIIEESPYSETFWKTLEAFRQQANGKEIVNVCRWHWTYIYIEVRHTGWQHYPCKYRAMVSWDASNGKLASFESENRGVFARCGWGRFMDDLVGREVPRYRDCGQRDRAEHC